MLYGELQILKNYEIIYDSICAFNALAMCVQSPDESLQIVID